MAVKINSFGGIIIWILRKNFSGITSKVMLNFTARYYKRNINNYIDWFLKQDEAPVFYNVMIETVNRCNGKCSFCPANIRDERREYAKMDDKLYKSIIRELAGIQWKGKLFLNVNNEPFVDVRIEDMAKFAKDVIPEAEITLISNGTLLNENRVRGMVGSVDELVINDYGKSYKLSDNIRKIYHDIKENEMVYQNINVIINRRYSEEILATRAGSAPNKPFKNNRISYPCIYPYTDLIIFPTGKVGLCCNDCFEITEFGQAGEQPLLDIWRCEEFDKIRYKMANGRVHCVFCEECDVVDAGGRERYIKSMGL